MFSFFVCLQDYLKTTELIFLKTWKGGGGAGGSTKDEPIYFWNT